MGLKELTNPPVAKFCEKLLQRQSHQFTVANKYLLLFFFVDRFHKYLEDGVIIILKTCYFKRKWHIQSQTAQCTLHSVKNNVITPNAATCITKHVKTCPKTTHLSPISTDSWFNIERHLHCKSLNASAKVTEGGRRGGWGGDAL